MEEAVATAGATAKTEVDGDNTHTCSRFPERADEVSQFALSCAAAGILVEIRVALDLEKGADSVREAGTVEARVVAKVVTVVERVVTAMGKVVVLVVEGGTTCKHM